MENVNTNNDYKANDLVDPAQGAATWQARYALARANQERMFKRFSDWYDALYAQIGKVPSPWKSKVYMPILARQVWTLMAKFLVLEPGFQVEVRDEDLDEEKIAQKAEKAQRKLEYDYHQNQFEESMRDKLFSPLLDAIVTGTGIAEVPWTVSQRTVYERLKDENDVLDLSKQQKKTITEGYNDLQGINVFNFFTSPASKNMYKAPWHIVKSYIPISDLEAVNKAEKKIIYKNLDKLNGKVSYDTYAAYDRSRNRLLSNADPTDMTVRMVALYKCYEINGTITYYAENGAGGNESEGWMELRKETSVYWHGKYPLVKFHMKKKSYNFWGEGIFEITYRLGAAYNDIINHFFDALNVAIDPMLIAPESANVDDYVIEPAGLIQYKGDVAPQPFKHVMPDVSAIESVTGILDSAVEGVTVSQYASGMPNDETDKTKGTAAGIQSLQEAAGDLITFFRINFMQSVLQIGKMWLSNNQQFMIRPVTVTTNTPEGPKAVKIKPADIQGDMDLTMAEDSMQPLTQQQKIQNYQLWVQAQIGLQNQSFAQNKILGTPAMGLDFNKLSEDLSEKFNMVDFSKVLVPQKELEEIHQQQMQTAMQHVQQSQAQQQQGEAQKTQAQQPTLMDSLQIKYTDLPEDIKQRVNTMLFGGPSNDPSPVEQGNMLKAMDTVTKTAKTSNDMQKDAHSAAHDVIKHASEMHQKHNELALQMAQQQQTNQLQQQQAQQQNNQPGGGQQGGVSGGSQPQAQ